MGCCRMNFKEKWPFPSVEWSYSAINIDYFRRVISRIFWWRYDAGSKGEHMATHNNGRLAVLIDADNAQASVIQELLAEVSRYGTATIKRAYGDWTTTNLKGWKDVLHNMAIQPMQQFSYTSGKNATDSALIIDAMDVLHTGQGGRLLPGVVRQRLHPAGHAHPRGGAGGVRLW